MATLHEFGIIPVARALNGKLLVQKEITLPLRMMLSGRGKSSRTCWAEKRQGLSASRAKSDSERWFGPAPVI
jgi:hypothetical protein